MTSRNTGFFICVFSLLFAFPLFTQTLPSTSDDKTLEEYKVKKNDSLTKIAKEVLNDPGKWKEFLKYNQIQNPSLIKEGMVLKVPSHLRKIVEPEAQPIASLEIFFGVVEYAKKTKEGAPSIWNSVSKNQILREGETLKTGNKSGASLAFLENQTKVKIYEKSSFSVSKKGSPEIFLERGQLQADVKSSLLKNKKNATAPKLIINTPVAVVGVRGTKFYVGSEEDQRTDVGCFEGVVNVEGAGKGVDVKAGFGTYVEKGKPPVEPFPIPNKIQIDKEFQSK
ncbi:FecR domain-containing protein [Leptospira stimsonii]|uniref:LysM peptidoglycan-binding domain-containing protein n=1 Tax=Leptospira stimsonii TaxID=2202203 RepID=A0ABY2MV40_9LEPT|nr:FecR domain-containing protein [Leptospira stimsonii]TGK25401.1 LysM peptidoglycan-binding domain-containing protein [Leptospira stimsonii]TGM08820.1 LysM peptidoglycan-binding domain-containing protein [Leptospira stimsonii]